MWKSQGRNRLKWKKKEFWHSNIEVSGWNETDFRDKRGHTYLPVPDKKSKCGGTLQLAVEFQRMKAMNWWPCARLQDHWPSVHARYNRATRNHKWCGFKLNPQKPFGGSRRRIVCIYFCSICSGTASHKVHKSISIKAAKRSIVFRHSNQRFITFYNNIINKRSFLKNQVDSPRSGSKRCLTVRGLQYEILFLVGSN